jgi:hypothetical protein
LLKAVAQGLENSARFCDAGGSVAG